MNKDEKGRQIYVPCGKCAWCRKTLRDAWFFRFKNESKGVPYVRFVTLTYEDGNLPYTIDEETGEMHMSVCKIDVQQFIKAIRNDGNKFRYFLASEYGPKSDRPHYHMLSWSSDRITFSDYWEKGFVCDLPANEPSFKYVTKYLLKGSNVPEGAVDNFRLMSRRPGIGASFVYKGEPYILSDNGVKVVPGHYYRRRYLASLNEKLRDSVMESTKDYLAGKERHSELLKLYESGSKAVSFEQWLDERYRVDLKKQVKINKNAKT